jgi:exonuclease III
MKVITWNVCKAGKNSSVWDLLLKLNSDIMLLQEVGEMPDKILKSFDVLSKIAVKKTGEPQKFRTAILVKGTIIEEISLKSKYDWVNKELEFFKGNFVKCSVELRNHEKFNVVSIYSPSWAVDRNRIKNIDVSKIKLKGNPDVWGVDIIWSALKNNLFNDESWIVGGDYNTSEKFDKEWQDKNGVRYGLRSSGNKEVLDRMYEIGFGECLKGHNKKIIPTLNHNRWGIRHQIDHLFVTNNLYKNLIECNVGDKSIIFKESLSDHLPIIANFKDK